MHEHVSSCTFGQLFVGRLGTTLLKSERAAMRVPRKVLRMKLQRSFESQLPVCRRHLHGLPQFIRHSSLHRHMDLPARPQKTSSPAKKTQEEPLVGRHVVSLILNAEPDVREVEYDSIKPSVPH